MNKVILMGRLTRDPDVRYSAGENALAIARYTLAVDRRFKRDGEASADFISCVAFGRSAEFACLLYTSDRAGRSGGSPADSEGRTGGFDVRISAYALYKRRGSIFFFETEVKISRKM